MQALFVAHGPSIESGIVLHTIASVDIYALMCSLLGIEPAPNDGNPLPTQAMLKTPLRNTH
jgi:hypothetical protein